MIIWAEFKRNILKSLEGDPCIDQIRADFEKDEIEITAWNKAHPGYETVII